MVVGPAFTLTGEVWTTNPEVTLTVRRHHGEPVATARSTLLSSDGIRLSLDHAASQLTDDDRVEIYRLLSRVALGVASYGHPLVATIDVRLAPDARAALLADGFESTDWVEWRRPPVAFRRAGAKAETMDEVYDDLYSVPWNFVGREWDVLDRLMGAGPAPADVIDLGCGVGKNASALEEAGYRVFGIDASLRAISLCQSAVRCPARYIVGSAALLPWRSESFDRALDVGCFHCMAAAQLEAGVREAARVLRPGGLLYSRVFKPRSRSWVESQPVARSSFGLAPAQLVATLGRHFDCEAVDEQEHLVYVRARKSTR